jgi:TPP-dependent pyruvate/acetoin dehydrogenase alpha subunit
MTKEYIDQIKKLKKFESKVADLFNNKKIQAPIHLYDGNEINLIKIFKQIYNKDWILCSWRSHYQCLLKGVSEKKLLSKIISGHSISLCFKKEKIFSSAIVGGSLPIALGIAMALKIQKKKSKVFCFIGDMTSETGIAHECIKYANNFKLPIKFIVEDNNLSVCTDTRKIWKLKKLTYEIKKNDKVIYYKYKNKFPHAGAGIRVQF